jgi:hypothetical protein
MLFWAHKPVPSLARFVDHLWCLNDAPAHQLERVLPAGTLELVINLDQNEFRIHDRERPGQYQRFAGAIVSGAYSRYFVIDTREHASIIGVHFKPGGALPFFAVPPGALADRHVELEQLWGVSARELREQLCEERGIPSWAAPSGVCWARMAERGAQSDRGRVGARLEPAKVDHRIH